MVFLSRLYLFLVSSLNYCNNYGFLCLWYYQINHAVDRFSGFRGEEDQYNGAWKMNFKAEIILKIYILRFSNQFLIIVCYSIQINLKNWISKRCLIFVKIFYINYTNKINERVSTIGKHKRIITKMNRSISNWKINKDNHKITNN